jgi:hypothetical protein
MTERDELRRRVGAILETEYPREWVAEDVTGQQYSEWYREKADVVLAEIERTHVLVPKEWPVHEVIDGEIHRVCPLCGGDPFSVDAVTR